MSHAPRQNLRLLLVDDDAEDAQIFRRRCPEGFVVEHVTQAAAALEHLRRASCDCCFVDYRLGPESGLDLIRDARAQGSRMPLILITGQDLEGLGENALLAGATDFVPKDGIDRETVQRIVRWALIRRHVENRIEADVAADSLTRLASRAAFMIEGEAMVQRARQKAQPLALVLVDLPGLDRVQRTLGRQAADRALLAMAAAARWSARSWDLCARTGADEIAILLPGASIEDARLLAQAVVAHAAARMAPLADAGGIGAAALASLEVRLRHTVASRAAADSCLHNLIERADSALALAAQSGREIVAA